MILLLHGGAGNLKIPDIAQPKQDAVADACRKVSGMGLSVLDAVEEAVALMELNPELNAGLGSVVQIDGKIRMDAGICTSDGRYAGVTQIEDVKNPVRVARRLLDYGYHSILSGAGARAFASECGFDVENVMTDGRRQEYERVKEELGAIKYEAIARGKEEINTQKLSTVGAVAVDRNGNMAAACSTGGTKYCYPGRVSDSSLLGAGVYCSEHVAVACTGEGDKFIRRLTARRVEDLYLSCKNLEKAVKLALEDLEKAEQAFGGIIAVSKDGGMAYHYNTAFMSLAHNR